MTVRFTTYEPIVTQPQYTIPDNLYVYDKYRRLIGKEVVISKAGSPFKGYFATVVSTRHDGRLDVRLNAVNANTRLVHLRTPTSDEVEAVINPSDESIMHDLPVVDATTSFPNDVEEGSSNPQLETESTALSTDKEEEDELTPDPDWVQEDVIKLRLMLSMRGRDRPVECCGRGAKQRTLKVRIDRNWQDVPIRRLTPIGVTREVDLVTPISGPGVGKVYRIKSHDEGDMCTIQLPGKRTLKTQLRCAKADLVQVYK
ncbi:hypothetical protein CVT24_002212 [Panaeolus cyanescens]|uniref:KOW domain-containing protein n=1 Tax=Panaeolus cyanescens TaxID=181874 RepID=A0A409X4T1_9AGAR|nr:hypothetical protein CVT24_002212 [Panaeolus cyanescens]